MRKYAVDYTREGQRRDSYADRDNNPRLQKTFDAFIKTFHGLRGDMSLDAAWAETMFTWANILTHRAQLVSYTDGHK